MSVVVSSTVLLYATIADVRDRAAAKRAEQMARAYEQMLEVRVTEREELAKAYEQKLEERVLGHQQELEKRIMEREEIARAYEQKLEERVQADHILIEQILHNSIENILGVQLERIRIEDYKQLDEIQKAVVTSNEALRAELAEKALIASNESVRGELAELKELVQALHQNHFGKSTISGS